MRGKNREEEKMKNRNKKDKNEEKMPERRRGAEINREEGSGLRGIERREYGLRGSEKDREEGREE